MSRLLSAREALLWTVGFLLVSTIIVGTDFSSADPDSALYAGIAERLSQEPIARWVAPEWWGFWPEANMTGLFREHPAGVFWVPAALAALTGLPAVQGAYVSGALAGLLSLVLLGVLVDRIGSRADARAVLVLLQLMPVAFIFRIRANHEYPMLLCLLLVIVGLDGLKRSRWQWVLVAAGITGGLLIKGVFVSLILLAAALWLVADPLRTGHGIRRQWTGLLAAIGLAALVAVAYDLLYVGATGETFWAAYWARQLGPITIMSPWQDAAAVASRLVFYLTRLLWHPAPWSIALVWLGLRRFGAWRDLPIGERRGLAVALAFVVLSIVVLVLPSRYAERYAFSATFVVGVLGAIAARRAWPSLAEAISRLDRTVPALPAAVWTLLAVARLGLGPYLPRP
jgi:4-amino-4-deoxy-L-arabinose transferase-like glycosyltransferase